jgi:hypothetical protein
MLYFIGQPSLKIVCGISSSDRPPTPDSLDMSPSDFFLFGDLKTKLKSEELKSMEELQDRTDELLGQITSETMRRVSDH